MLKDEIENASTIKCISESIINHVSSVLFSCQLNSDMQCWFLTINNLPTSAVRFQTSILNLSPSFILKM